ncbi:type I-E CRISPR-associated protein Cse2/CasB [Streptomyces buecherae]|uniref:type I-E CRISPR-associated protein Cse2/CasB n=1 Tax=Streptomyces buecherae TaxID=2763006 RepID=UPI0036610120
MTTASEARKADAPPPTSTKEPRRSIVWTATDRHIRRLQGLYRRDQSAGAAAVAQLRRGAGKLAYEAPEAWGSGPLEELTWALEEERAKPQQKRPEQGPHQDQQEQQELGQEIESPATHPRRRATDSAEEEAVHLATSLWALHQQSIRDADMHAAGWGIGLATRRLAQGRTGHAEVNTRAAEASGTPNPRSGRRPDEELNEALRKRFVRLGTATSLEALATRLRELVLLLRQARIPLDYARLAHELRAWQDENKRAGVRRSWGRDFHASGGNPPGQRDTEDGAPPADGDTTEHDEPTDSGD